MKWLEEKHVQVEHVERPNDSFVQVFISPQVYSCHSTQQLLGSSLSFYLCMYICTLKVYGALHIAQLFSFRTQHQSHYYSEPLKSENANFNFTAFAWRLVRLGDMRLVLVVREHGWLLASHAKRTCLHTLLDVKNAISPCFLFLLYEQ